MMHKWRPLIPLLLLLAFFTLLLGIIYLCLADGDGSGDHKHYKNFWMLGLSKSSDLLPYSIVTENSVVKEPLH